MNVIPESENIFLSVSNVNETMSREEDAQFTYETPNVVSSGIPQFTYETPNVVSSGIPQFTYETPSVVSSGIPQFAKYILNTIEYKIWLYTIFYIYIE